MSDRTMKRPVIEGSVPRHKTAIHRADLSRPVKCALRDGVITAGTSVFDYGCGHGFDVELLRAQGIDCGGWDPTFRPYDSVAEADVVNLGYVINVIENPGERSQTLLKAWALARRTLIVSAQLHGSGDGNFTSQYADGVLTRRGTFQKFYDQDELQSFLEGELKTAATPAALGVFYLFKDESLRQQILADRFRRRIPLPSLPVSELLFEENRAILEPFNQTISQLGRLPERDECQLADEIERRFGSLKRAFEILRRVTSNEEWQVAGRRRTEDLLVYIALSRFRRRPPFSVLPVGLQRDIRTFLGSYTKACQRADELLFRAGNREAIDKACQLSPIGQLTPNGLLVHRSALDSLDPLLRVYEGCARAYLGEIEGACIVKLHRYYPKVSYYECPTFESDPHPPLMRRVKFSLRELRIKIDDYSGTQDVPIVHRKETLLVSDHPLYKKFKLLTQKEESNGLLEDVALIGTRETWLQRLLERDWQLKGHRLIRIAKRSGKK